MGKNLVVDAGANHGLFSFEIAIRNPDLTVVAVEADPELAEFLERGAAEKELKNHLVLCHAIDEVEGMAPFHISDLGDKGTSSLLSFDERHTFYDEYWSQRNDLRHSRTIMVERKRLDTLLANFDFDEISFIKIDIQGYDLAALASMGRYLDKVRAGMLEVVGSEKHSLYHEDRATMVQALSYLRDNGFSIHAIKPNDPAGNEYNIFFTRSDVDHEAVEAELALRGMPLYDGKHFWHLPDSQLRIEISLENLPAYRELGELISACRTLAERQCSDVSSDDLDGDGSGELLRCVAEKLERMNASLQTLKKISCLR